jgi:hypothetical protein
MAQWRLSSTAATHRNVNNDMVFVERPRRVPRTAHRANGPPQAVHTGTRGRAKLEQSEMVGILGLQRADQDLKLRKLL